MRREGLAVQDEASRCSAHVSSSVIVCEWGAGRSAVRPLVQSSFGPPPTVFCRWAQSVPQNKTCSCYSVHICIDLFTAVISAATIVNVQLPW